MGSKVSPGVVIRHNSGDGYTNSRALRTEQQRGEASLMFKK